MCIDCFFSLWKMATRVGIETNLNVDQRLIYKLNCLMLNPGSNHKSENLEPSTDPLQIRFIQNT